MEALFFHAVVTRRRLIRPLSVSNPSFPLLNDPFYLLSSMLFGNLYIYFEWNGRTEIPGRFGPACHRRYDDRVLVEPS